MGLFGRRKTQGRVFGAEKKTPREWGHAIPRFSINTGFFSRQKTQGRVFGGGKNPCGKHADSHPGFGQGPVSNLILKIKYLGKGSNLPLQSSGTQTRERLTYTLHLRGSNPVPPGCVIRVPTHWAI